jgi:hypothetical protein
MALIAEVREIFGAVVTGREFRLCGGRTLAATSRLDQPVP